ncbi:Ribonuclease H [Aedoeadaptatus ivorii]|uniref:Ribonuclease H n=1 Tax=Aedoeadaptatus ivorii TaxID=54006 RepID=A0A3S5F7T3_9FIRM|nr:ribonuclease H family protein [Peptoniphilus ivorii]MDQ0507971.1 ribonuclease HI [Peptoniphilus ivorii]VEJ34803.1 Ribonuclease H [Peptoniphilus ivorii]
MKKKFYAVRKGKTPGIYEDWDSCKAQVHGVKGAVYKSFATRAEAEAFLSPADAPTQDDGLIAYVDGSYRHADKSYSYGVVLLDGEMRREYSRRFSGEMAEMRNVAGEILGARKAMEEAIALGYDRLILHYDYAGIEHWAKGEWKRNKKGTAEYKTFYDSVKDALSVRFVKVAAHTGVEENERADALAKAAEF